MDESDSDSSVVERMFEKYSKTFKKDFNSNQVPTTQSLTSAVVAPVASGSATNLNKITSSSSTPTLPAFTLATTSAIASGSAPKSAKKNTRKTTKRPKKKTKRNQLVYEPDEKNNSDPDYVPARNYDRMSSKELDNIAARVRIFHETGVVLSDDENVIPCKNKNPKKKQPVKRLPRLEPFRTHIGTGQIGMSWSKYGVRRCACCNLRKEDCLSNLPNASTSANTFKTPTNTLAPTNGLAGPAGMDIAESLGISNPDFSNMLRRLSTGAINRFKKREEQLYQMQHRDLLRHPELADEFDDDDEDSFEAEPPPPPVLSKEKYQWIQRFIDSMTPDRIDYEKPEKRNIVEGINHSPVDEEAALLKRILEKHAGYNTATIIERIDFKKEKERRSRLAQAKLDQWLIPKNAAASSTPNFNSTELEQTAVLTPSESTIDLVELSPIRKEGTSTAKPFDVSGVEIIEDSDEDAAGNTKDVLTPESEPSVVNEVATTSKQKTDDKTNNNDDAAHLTLTEHNYVDFSHLDRSNVTLRAPTSGRKFKPIGADDGDQRYETNPDNNKGNMEANIMDFVDDLLGGEVESINKEVEERCERLLEHTRKTRNLLNNALETYALDIYENEHIDDPVEIFEDIVAFPVGVTDGPSTSVSRPTRRAAKKRKPTQQVPTIARKKKATDIPLTSTSKLAIQPPDPESKDEKDADEDKAKGSTLRDCPICLEPLRGKEISSTICGHVFCTACIAAAVRAQRSCPNCRTKLTLKKIHPLFI